VKSELAELLANLEGRHLPSIRAGCDLEFLRVDARAGQVHILDSAGKPRTRSMRELQTLWTALQTREVVHVDSALKGSGSSRNQPETILANLPMVEWLVIGRRKYLALADRECHSYGTIRRMDDMAAAERVLPDARPISEVIVVSEITSVAQVLARAFGEPEPVTQGVYKYTGESRSVLLAREDCASDLSRGAYAVMGGPAAVSETRGVRVGPYRFRAREADDVTFLYEERSTSAH